MRKIAPPTFGLDKNNFLKTSIYRILLQFDFQTLPDHDPNGLCNKQANPNSMRSDNAHIHFSIDMQMTQGGLVASGGEFKSPTL